MKIIFTKRKKFNFISWLTAKWMGVDYSHVALSFVMLGEELVVDATRHGVRLMTMSNFIKKVNIVYSIDVPNKSKGNKAIAYCFANMGDKYSFWSIIGIMFKKKIWGNDGESKFICSELMARAFDIKHKNIDQITVKEFKEIMEK